MQLDASLPPAQLSSIPVITRAAEALGFAGLWSSETTHDPFLPGALVAEHSHKLLFGTAIAVSFARSPATLAYTAWDLAQALQGRFVLGLGTQVKAHIKRRFGMDWPASVVGKLREQIAAIRAFWRCWQSGEQMNFRGEYYQLTLMSPFFNPGPISHPDVPIFIAGVNSGLATLAGEAANGFLVHPLHSAAYLKEIILPAIQAGAINAGRSPEEVGLTVTAMVVTSKEELNFVRAQIAFYASTPSYRLVMAHHGWEAVAEKLSGLAGRGEWAEMPTLVSDEMVSTFAVVADANTLAEKLLARYGGWVERLSLYLPFQPGERDDFWRMLIKDVGKV
jgi:probable F420-dependent oxidoreductase